MRNYRELEKELFEFTEEWSKDKGEFKLQNKIELENATAILEQHYDEVSNVKLDYTKKLDDGTPYKISFNTLKFVPNKDASIGPMGDNAGAGLGEDYNHSSSVFNVFVEDFDYICEDTVTEVPEEDMSYEKTLFVQYCSSKVRDLGSVTFEFEGVEHVNEVYFTHDLIGEGECRITTISEDGMFVSVNANDKVVGEPEYDIFQCAASMNFTAISTRFYYEILDNWDNIQMDELIESFLGDIELLNESQEDEEQLFVLYLDTFGAKVKLCTWEATSEEEAIKQFLEMNPSYRKRGELIARRVIKLQEAIEKHSTLNPTLFEDNRLKDDVKEKLLYIVGIFLRNLKEDGIELEPNDIVLLGSNASYNYTDKSDIDVHIIANTSMYDEDTLINKLYDAYRRLFNNKYDPIIGKHEVELYVEPNEINAKSNGVYSILNNTWIKEPDVNAIPEVNMDEVNAGLEEYKARFNGLIAKDDLTIEDIDMLIDDMYLLRTSSVYQQGEYALGNLIFKEFRNLGLLDKLKDLKVDLETELMSLHESRKVDNLMKLYESLRLLEYNRKDLKDFVGVEYANKFFELRNKLQAPQNDLGYWIKKGNPQELIDLINGYASGKLSSKTQAKKDAIIQGANKLYEDDRWTVYDVSTYSAMKFIGRGTKWCIAGNYPGHEGRGQEYFDSYKEKKYLGGYVVYIDKKNDTKYCVCFEDPTRMNKSFDVWNAADNEVGVLPDAPSIPGIQNLTGLNIEGDTLVNTKWGSSSRNMRVTVPSKVKHIAPRAFKDTYLSLIEFPDTLQTIGMAAFANTRLEHVSIPKSVTEVGRYAFAFIDSDGLVVEWDSSHVDEIPAMCFAYTPIAFTFKVGANAKSNIKLNDKAFDGYDDSIEFTLDLSDSPQQEHLIEFAKKHANNIKVIGVNMENTGE